MTSTARMLPIRESLQPFNQSAFEAAPTNGSADVVVIGAGMARLATAHSLRKQECRVAIVDCGGVGAGESLRTTAHLASARDDRCYHLVRWLNGPAAAALSPFDEAPDHEREHPQ